MDSKTSKFPVIRTVYEAPKETNIPDVIYLPSGPIVDQTPLEPCQLFDDMYYIGNTFVGTLVVKTTVGLVLIDSMNSREDVDNIILPGLATLGLNVKDIVCIIITHGHFDHIGGAKYLQDLSGCKVAMSKIEYEVYKNYKLPPDMLHLKLEYPIVDVFVEDNTKLTYGDTIFSNAFTPGHTIGGISLTFNVHDNGEEHVVGLWGGTGIPRALEDVKIYLESAKHFIKFTEQAGADVEFSVHPFVDYSVEKMKKIRHRKEGQANPLILGRDKFSLFMYCIKANAEGKIAEYSEES